MRHSMARWTEVASTDDAMGPLYPMLHVRFHDGTEYMIPEMWVIGFCRSGRTVAEAIQHWHNQEMLASQATTV